MPGGLEGRTIVLLEARRANEAAALVRRYGGLPWSVPAMREAPLDDRSESVSRLRELCAQGCDVAIFLTGVGARAMFELASDLGLDERLREVLDGALVAVRGPKPRAVLRDLGVRMDRFAAEPHTDREVLALFKESEEPIGRVALQLYGESDPALRDGLEARGGQVLELPLYRWAMPEDPAPLLELIDGLSGVDALVVTSASQLRNLFSLAESHGRAEDLCEGLRGLVVAAVGPVAARAAEDRGVHVTVQPEHPFMGALIRSLAHYFDPAVAG